MSTLLHHFVLLNKEKQEPDFFATKNAILFHLLRYGSLFRYSKCAVTAGFEPAISSVTSWHPRPTERCYHWLFREVSLFQVSHGTVRNLLYLNNFLWCGLSVDPHLHLFSSFSGLALVAQGLYTPASLLVRWIRLDLWCFHQDYHSHYTTLYSHVRAKDSCRIQRMPPLALSLLTILSLHLGSSVRLHITRWRRSITVLFQSH